MASETFIENNVIRNREKVLGVRDSLFLRSARIGRGFGIADLFILPQRGPHRIIVVEAKQSSSADAKIKVIGQLLMYYAGALELGAAAFASSGGSPSNTLEPPEASGLSRSRP